MKNIKSNKSHNIQSTQCKIAREQLKTNGVKIASQAAPRSKPVGFVAPPVREQNHSCNKNVSDQQQNKNTSEVLHKPSKPKKAKLHKINMNNEGRITTMNSTNNFFDNLVTLFTGAVRLISAIIRLIMVFVIGAAVIVNSYAFMANSVANNPKLAEDMPAIVELLDNSKEVASDSADFLLDVQNYWNNFWTSEAMTNPEADRSFTDDIFYQLKLGTMKLRNLIVPATNIEAN